MKNLMYNIACSDIRLAELKLNRVRLCKMRLLKNKPCRLCINKFNNWQSKMKKLEKEEENILDVINDLYKDLEKHIFLTTNKQKNS